MRSTDRPVVTLFQSISLNGMIGRPDGEGDFLMPMFEPAQVDLLLALRDVKRLTPTVLQLHYDVVRETPR
ncbi:MAG TPA: hypothetical protein VM582_07670 [Candidatus Thermoplasmatota archaeon]|nr:hypothetical protein [Candidatus Thermoplasmatota archaeon]